MGVEVTEKHKLYIRYPARIEDEFVIRSLHPNIIGVHLPRQKSRRWCVIDFENKDKLYEARSTLKKIKVQDKSIKIRPYQKGPIKKSTQKRKRTKESSKEASTSSLMKLLKKH